MKKVFVLPLFALLLSCTTLQQAAGSLPPTKTTPGAPSQSQVVEGLKQALTIGTQNSTNRLSAVDGFFADAAVKILMPPEAKSVEKTLRTFGLGSLVDKTILSLNRAAEDAAKSATPIFVDAIKQMTITDALGILQGGDFAATNYFKTKTTIRIYAQIFVFKDCIFNFNCYADMDRLQKQ